MQAGVWEAFARAGGERGFCGRLSRSFAFGSAGGGDAANVTRYCSPTALAGMWLDPPFIAAHENRMDGVECSQVLIFPA
jgi:hypothetical protein